MLGPTDVTHILAADIALVAPYGFKGAFTQGATSVMAREVQSGSMLTYLCKSGASGTSTAQLLQSLIAVMQKRYPGAVLAAEPQPATGEGWSGLVQMMRAGSALDKPLRLVLTALVLPEPNDATKQRHVAVILEVPDQEFDQRLMHYRRFAELRLRVGKIDVKPGGPALQPSPHPELSLLPLDDAPSEINPLKQAANAPSPPLNIKSSVSGANPGLVGAPRAMPNKQNLKALRDQAEATQNADDCLELAAKGQRAVIRSLILSFLVNGLHSVPDVPILLTFAFGVALLFYSIHGALGMASGLGLKKNPKLLLMLACSVPLINLVCWLVLSRNTTHMLREAGYQVGLFGARA